MEFADLSSEDLAKQICLTVRGNVGRLIQTELQCVDSNGLREILDSGESSVLVQSIREKLGNRIAQTSGDLLIYMITFRLLHGELSPEEFREYVIKMLSCIEKVTAY